MRSAARWWIAAQAIFVLGTIGYALIDPVPRRFHWSLWLIFAVGPRFTTVTTGVCSIAVCLLCAAMWASASWKLGGIGRDDNPLRATVVRWGGLAFLLMVEPLQRVLSRGSIETPVYVDQAVRTLEVVFCLLIALHLRKIGRRMDDRVPGPMLDLLVLVVGLNLLGFAPSWLGLELPRNVYFGLIALPIARAVTFLVVMSRLLAAGGVAPEQRPLAGGASAT